MQYEKEYINLKKRRTKGKERAVKQVRDWDDLHELLYEGSKEELKKVVCPDCEGKISYRYCEEVNTFEITCKQCGYIERGFGSPKPACVKFFGDVYTFM